MVLRLASYTYIATHQFWFLMYGCSSKASGVCGLSTVLDAELACAAQEVPYGALPPLSTNVNPQCVHSHSREPAYVILVLTTLYA